MDAFLQWISATPVAAMILLSLLVILVLAMVAAVTVGLYEGREISLWSPKLGARPLRSDGGDGVGLQASAREARRFKQGIGDAGDGTDLTAGAGDGENSQGRNRPVVPSFRLASKPIAVVEGVEGPVGGNVYMIVAGHRDITVGRDAGCDLPIASNLLSRHHFRLRISLIERTRQAERGFRIELIDSGSANGTFLNGELVAGPAVVGSGDRIEAGDCALRVFVLDTLGTKQG